MKQRFLARMRAALDEIEQNAPADLALFEYVDLLTAQVAELAAPRDLSIVPRRRAICIRRGLSSASPAST
jgi:hypothetical protein